MIGFFVGTILWLFLVDRTYFWGNGHANFFERCYREGYTIGKGREGKTRELIRPLRKGEPRIDTSVVVLFCLFL